MGCDLSTTSKILLVKGRWCAASHVDSLVHKHANGPKQIGRKDMKRLCWHV